MKINLSVSVLTWLLMLNGGEALSNDSALMINQDAASVVEANADVKAEIKPSTPEISPEASAAKNAVTTVSIAAAPKQASETSIDVESVQIDPSEYVSLTFDWIDSTRQRAVPVRLYLPPQQKRTAPLDLVVFSHGIGGSREGYTYLGQYFASKGIAAMHVQHVGSDRQLWIGNPFSVVSRLASAASDAEAIARAKDVSFALDQLLQSELGAQVNRDRIIAAGHSYGANTSMLLAGAEAESQGSVVVLRDPRIRAAIFISAPPFYGAKNLPSILAPVHIPTLHITATADDIKIPGYLSGVNDRIEIYQTTGQGSSVNKVLAVFKDGSHSVFTDRKGTGGVNLNPRIKRATRELMLTFVQNLDDPAALAYNTWTQRHQSLLSSFERTTASGLPVLSESTTSGK
jgi:dienelactone hydrolase